MKTLFLLATFLLCAVSAHADVVLSNITHAASIPIPGSAYVLGITNPAGGARLMLVTQVQGNLVAPTNDLNTVIRAFITDCTNGVYTSAQAYSLAVALAATNDLNTVLRAFISACTNNAQISAAATVLAATNDLNTVLRALITGSTNANYTSATAYALAATNSLNTTLRTYTDNATNDLNTVLRAFVQTIIAAATNNVDAGKIYGSIPSSHVTGYPLTPSQFGARKTIYWYPSAGSLAAIGIATPTVQGNAGVQVLAAGGSHKKLTYYTPAVTANTNSITMAADIPHAKSATYIFNCQVTNAIDFRMWVALSMTTSTASLANLETNSALSVLGFLGSSTNAFGLATTNWMFMSDDANAAHWNMKDTGVTIQTSVTNFTIVTIGNGTAMTSAIGYINGNPVATNTANLPSTGTPAVQGIGIATLATAAAGFNFVYIYDEIDL